jgi:hypothetical protein
LAETPLGLNYCRRNGAFLETRSKFGTHAAYLPNEGNYVVYRNANGDSFWDGGNSNKGTVSLWLRANAFSGDLIKIGYGSSCTHTPSNNNLIRIWVLGGNLELWIYDKDGIQIIHESVAHGMSKFVYSHIELNWDVEKGVTRLFVDGTEKIYRSNTGDRADTNYPTNSIVLGRVYNNGIRGRIDDLFILNYVLHTSNFTPPTIAGPP